MVNIKIENLDLIWMFNEMIILNVLFVVGYWVKIYLG